MKFIVRRIIQILNTRQVWRGEQAGVLIESALSLGLFATIAVGMGQQYIIVLDRLEHESLATELMLGPQERSMQFDTTNYAFVPITNGQTSDPTLDTFMNTIGNFFESRAPANTTLKMRLYYLNTNRDTGVTTGSSVGSSIYTYPTSPQAECATAELDTELNEYATATLSTMVSYIPSGAGSKQPVGGKLYDITLAGTQHTGYMEQMAVVFMMICSPDRNYLFPQQATSLFTLVPRRTVN